MMRAGPTAATPELLLQLPPPRPMSQTRVWLSPNPPFRFRTPYLPPGFRQRPSFAFRYAALSRAEEPWAGRSHGQPRCLVLVSHATQETWIVVFAGQNQPGTFRVKRVICIDPLPERHIHPGRPARGEPFMCQPRPRSARRRRLSALFGGARVSDAEKIPFHRYPKWHITRRPRKRHNLRHAVAAGLGRKPPPQKLPAHHRLRPAHSDCTSSGGMWSG